jgi:hypothetical protein
MCGGRGFWPLVSRGDRLVDASGLNPVYARLLLIIEFLCRVATTQRAAHETEPYDYNFFEFFRFHNLISLITFRDSPLGTRDSFWFLVFTSP